MAGRKLPTEFSLCSWAAAARRTRDGLAAALRVVGPIVAVLVALILIIGGLLWQAATSWSSTTRRAVFG
eukprot:586524-Alexandrium_andersonii.AAC.1